MPPNDLTAYLRTLTRAVTAEGSDAELLQRFLATRDPVAFEAVLRRHGAMVYLVCRRAAGREEDAEDAFQATFLVLARNAGALRNGASLASWLHGAARRIALKARARAAAERRREAAVALPESAPPADPGGAEVRVALDEELARLPERSRLPLVLCLLEGRTQDEAARALGWSKSTLRRRLDAARAALARRLSRRGIGPAALAVALSVGAGPAAVPPALLDRVLCSLGSPSAPPPARVLDLTKGVPTAMWVKKLVAAVAALVAAVGWSVLAGQPAPKADKQKTVMIPLDKLMENGVSYDPAATTAPVVYKDLMLVLVGADGAAAVVFGREDDTEPSVEYRYRYQSRDGKQNLSGTGKLKDGPISDLKAGSITVGWSRASLGRGWVYYDVKSVRIQIAHAREFDDRVEDLIPPFPDGRKVTWPKLDLKMFMQEPRN